MNNTCIQLTIILSLISLSYTQSNQQSSIISILDHLLDLVSSLANTLKIIFQLTALLFIITQLVNFWNLASIYIFAPIQIPTFALNILSNVWTQFNQPILALFNINFDTVTFRDSLPTYQSGQQYKSSLYLNISEIALEPIVILSITTIQLFFLTMVLNWIKNSFRNIRQNISKGVNIQNLYPNNPTQISENKLKFVSILLKNNKIQPINNQKQPNKQQVNCLNQIIQKNKKQIQQIQQSMKNIFDPSISQIIIAPKQNLNNSKNQINKNKQIHPQLKFMCLIHKIASQKIKSSKIKIKTQKHWSQTIEIDLFQIVSALIISFMPVLLLPLYQTIKQMQYHSLKEKINILIYLLIMSVLFVYPFIYLTSKLHSTKKKIRKFKKKVSLKKENIQNKIINKKQSNSTKISLKEQVFETFCLFFMNMSISISVAITQSAMIFLSLNLIVHILLVASSIIFYRKKTCQGKFIKNNTTIQQLTFLLYHLCFCFVHIFNQLKFNLVEIEMISKQSVDMTDQILGMMIVGLFAIGGLHEMIQFLIKIMYNVFKLMYMILHVVVGGYDIKELEQQMRKYNNFIIESNNKNQNVNNKRIQMKKQQIVQGMRINTPHNTNRSIDELQIDFEIQIAKNEIIINKMKLQRFKHTESMNISCNKKQNQQGMISQINLAQLPVNRLNGEQNNQQLINKDNKIVSKNIIRKSINSQQQKQNMINKEGVNQQSNCNKDKKKRIKRIRQTHQLKLHISNNNNQ